jgi:hypothetical protein
MGKRDRANGVDLDRIEPRARRIAAVGAYLTGYYNIAGILVPAAALYFILPVAAQTPSPLLIGAAIGAALSIFTLYWSLAEFLRLNRFLTFILFWPGFIYILFAPAAALAGLGGAIVALFPTLSSEVLVAAEARVFIGTTGLVLAVGFAPLLFAASRSLISYWMSVFASTSTRRLLKPVDQAEAKLLRNPGAFIGGGVTTPTLRHGALAVGALNILRATLAGLTSLWIIIAFPVAMFGAQLASMSGLIPYGLYVMPLLVVGGAALVFGVAALLTFTARTCARAARSRARHSLQAMTRSDKRRPVLFLRPFHDDQVALKRSSSAYAWLAIDQKTRQLDHILVEEFSWAGPVIAIGRRGQKELPFGAARTFLSDQDWQKEALEMANAARHVVIIIDTTPGVRWELDQLTRPELRAKTLFLYHPDFLSTDSNHSVTARLSALLGEQKSALDKPIIGFWFESDGRARFLHSTQFSVDSYTLILRDFFRTSAALAKQLARVERRAARTRRRDRMFDGVPATP